MLAILTLLLSLISAKDHRLDVLIHVPDNSYGMSVVVACEAENSPVMDSDRQLDGMASNQEFVFTDVPAGQCEIDVNVITIDPKTKKEKYVPIHRGFIMSGY